MDIKIANKEDMELLRAFAERTFRVAYEAMNAPKPFNDYCTEAFSRERFLQEMADQNASFWIAWEAETIAAYLKLKVDAHTEAIPSGRTLQVERIYVAPEVQGRGIGKTMLDFAEQQARLLGANIVWLSVWKRNPRAVVFYERCGYDICGTEIFQLGDDPQLDWVMKKMISF